MTTHAHDPALILQMVGRSGLEDDEAGVCVAGSTLAGLGNPTSDVDVYVVSERLTLPEINRQVLHEGRRFDIEVIRPSALTALGRRMEAFTVTAETLPKYGDEEPYLAKMTRFFYAQIVQPSPALESALSSLRVNEAKLRTMVVGSRAFWSGNLHDDCIGNLQMGDVEQALLISGDVVREALQALTASRGELYGSAKFLLPKLRRLHVGEQFWDVLRGLLLTPKSDDLELLLRRRLHFAQVCLAVAQLGPEVDLSSWPSWDVAADAGLRRAQGDSAMRAGDVVVIGDASRGVGLASTGLTLWGLANGRPRDIVASDMATRLGPSGNGDRLAEVQAYIDQLLARSILVDG